MQIPAQEFKSYLQIVWYYPSGILSALMGAGKP